MTHSYILKKDHPPQCEHCQCILTVRHILVECNHLAQTRNDIFGRCVVESLQFHPELVLILFTKFLFLFKILTQLNCDILFIAQLFTLCFFNTFQFLII